MTDKTSVAKWHDNIRKPNDWNINLKLGHLEFLHNIGHITATKHEQYKKKSKFLIQL